MYKSHDDAQVLYLPKSLPNYESVLIKICPVTTQIFIYIAGEKHQNYRKLPWKRIF